MCSPGRVKIVKHTPEGKDVILEIISPPEIFGGVAALDGRPYATQTVYATRYAAESESSSTPGARRTGPKPSDQKKEPAFVPARVSREEERDGTKISTPAVNPW